MDPLRTATAGGATAFGPPQPEVPRQPPATAQGMVPVSGPEPPSHVAHKIQERAPALGQVPPPPEVLSAQGRTPVPGQEPPEHEAPSARGSVLVPGQEPPPHREPITPGEGTVPTSRQDPPPEGTPAIRGRVPANRQEPPPQGAPTAQGIGPASGQEQPPQGTPTAPGNVPVPGQERPRQVTPNAPTTGNLGTPAPNPQPRLPESPEPVIMRDNLDQLHQIFCARAEVGDVTIAGTALRQKGIGHPLRITVLTATGKDSVNDTTRRQILQAMGGTFPSTSMLFKWGKVPSPVCDLCCCDNATIGHMQCDCIKLKDARTQAHNNIWTNTWPKTEAAALAHKWIAMKETNITDAGLTAHKKFHLYQPDGILIKFEGNVIQEILIVDLGRTRGYGTEYFDKIEERKRTHYEPLADSLRWYYNCMVSILTLPIGYTGNISERHWNVLTTAIGATDKEARNFTHAAAAEGCRSFTYMTSMWRIAQQNAREARIASAGAT